MLYILQKHILEPLTIKRGFNINNEILTELESNIDAEPETEDPNKEKYWIHRIKIDYLKKIHEKKILGSEIPKSVLIKNIKPYDHVLFYTPFNIKRNKYLFFIGFSTILNVFDDDESYIDFDKSNRKLKIDDISYFSEPIAINKIKEYLEFTKGKNSSNYFRNEYKEIGKNDFDKLTKFRSSKEFPNYNKFHQFSFTSEEFLIKTIKALHNTLKITGKSELIAIKDFIKLFHEAVNYYEISKEIKMYKYADFEEFYSKNAIKLGFEHIPSRDLKKSVVLYDNRGNAHSFAYIKLKRG